MRLGSTVYLATLLAICGSVLATTGGGTDVCAPVNAVLRIASPLLPNKLITIGTLNVCLCISGVPSFVTTNPLALAAVAIGGKQAAINAIISLINSASGRQTCNYPGHSLPVCQTGYPCGFTCKDGFVPSPSYHPTNCVCPPPYTVCNGNCGNYRACPSGILRRDMHGKQHCPVGLSVCGVYGKGSNAWECVDTKSDLESCGGCMVSPHASIGADGVDCTAILGVSDVSCVRGQCIVHRCNPGYQPSPRGNECVYSEDLDPVLMAAEFGLDQTTIG